MSAKCSTCQHWSGPASEIMAYCKLHRDCHSFTVTGRECWCPSYTAIEGEQVSAQGHAPTGTLEGKPPLIEVLPANHKATVETWEDDE